jgi:hypothetical protein
VKRTTQDDHKEIYFVFLQVLYYFYQFCNIKQISLIWKIIWKKNNRRNSVEPISAQRFVGTGMRHGCGTTPGSCAQWWGGVVGALAIKAVSGRQKEYRCQASDSPGKVWWPGFHRSGATPKRRWMRASATMFPVPVAVSMVLVVGGGLLQVGVREREMRDESNSKKEEKRARGGGHHREQGEWQRPPLIPTSFEAGASGGVTNSKGRSGGCTRALWRRTTAGGGENLGSVAIDALGSVAIDAFYTAW